MCGAMSRGMRCDGHRGGTSKSNGSLPIDSFKITPIIIAIVCATKGNGASMDGTAARHEADEILAELPDRISDVIKPFARHSPEHPALVQGDVTWTDADLAAIVGSTAITLANYGIRPGDRVMIVSENSLALAAILFAASEIDAWSVVV